MSERMLNKKDATALAKQFRLGNRFRKKSIIKKYDLTPASSKNTGRVKMGIRMDVESKPREYYPALDDDGQLIFFTGNPIKRIPLSDLFTPPKAGKNRQRVPAKENAMINYKLEMLKQAFPNEDVSLLESYLESHDFDLHEFSLLSVSQGLKGYKTNILERTEYQLVAQKKNGQELKSSWYKNENELALMQQKCEDSDEYESHCVMKRIVDVDEDEEDKTDYTPTDGGILNNEVDEGKDNEEMLKLTTLALKQIPGSPKQRETIKKLNVIRKKLGMKPLKEMEIDINDEISESFYKVDIPGLPTTFVEADSLTEVRTAMREKLKPDVFGKIDIKKVSKAEITKKFRELAKDVGKPGGDSVKDIDEYVGPALTPANQIAKKHGGKVKTIMAKDEKGKKKKMFYVEDLEEAKLTLDTIAKKFKGADKKLGGGVIDMIKSKANPKEIAKSFKKLKTPTQELIMQALGDRSAQTLLQKGQLLNQLVGIFDEVDAAGLDGRSKTFKNKVKKLEYNKKKSLPYEMFENSKAADQAKRINLIHLGNGIYGRKQGEPTHKTVDGELTKMSSDEIKQQQGGDTEKKPEMSVPTSFEEINIDGSLKSEISSFWENVPNGQKINVYADDKESIKADFDRNGEVGRYYTSYLSALGIDHNEGTIERTDKNMAIFNNLGAIDNGKISELLTKITISQDVAKKVLAKAKGTLNDSTKLVAKRIIEYKRKSK